MKISNSWAVLAAALALTVVQFGARAQIMKCVSKDGRVEFASNCPPGTTQQSTSVGAKSGAAVASPAPATDGAKDAAAKGSAPAPKSLADRDAEFRKRLTELKEEEAKAAKKSAENEERQRNCRNAQGSLQTLKSRQRTYRVDPNTGERIAFEEADYQREEALAERVAAENCKG